MAKKSTKKNNNNNSILLYTIINFVVFGMIVLLSKNYLFQALDWLLDVLLNINYALYIVAIVFYIIVIFLMKNFLIGSFFDPVRDAKEDREFLWAAVIGLIAYILIDVYFFSSSLIEFSLL